MIAPMMPIVIYVCLLVVVTTIVHAPRASMDLRPMELGDVKHAITPVKHVMLQIMRATVLLAFRQIFYKFQQVIVKIVVLYMVIDV